MVLIISFNKLFLYEKIHALYDNTIVLEKWYRSHGNYLRLQRKLDVYFLVREFYMLFKLHLINISINH